MGCSSMPPLFSMPDISSAVLYILSQYVASLVTDLLTHVVYTNEQQWGYNPKSNFSNYTIQRHRWMTSTTHAYRALYEDLKKGTIHSVARINERLRNQ
jgi:hypothetical protein